MPYSNNYERRNPDEYVGRVRQGLINHIRDTRRDTKVILWSLVPNPRCDFSRELFRFSPRPRIGQKDMKEFLSDVIKWLGENFDFEEYGDSAFNSDEYEVKALYVNSGENDGDQEVAVGISRKGKGWSFHIKKRRSS